MKKSRNFRNKIISQIKFFILSIIFFSVESIAQPLCPVPCLTNVILLGTGWNHESNTLCTYQTIDSFWRITNAPNVYNVPTCTFSRIDQWNNWPPPIPPTTSNTSIGIDPFPIQSAGNKTNSANTCTLVTGDNPYWFDRQFFVCTGDSVTVSMGMLLVYRGDLVIPRVELFGPGGYYNLLDSICLFNGFVGTINNWSLHLATGIYTLRFHVLNDYDNYPWLGQPNGTTPMALQVGGSVFSTLGNNVLVDNLHFGKSVGVCAPPYAPSPEFDLIARHCMKDSSDTAQVHITPYYDSIGQNVYVVNGPLGNVVIDTSGMFIATVGTYTITSTDKWGCTYDSVFHLYLNPNFSVTPPFQCVPVGANGNIALHVDSSILNYGFQTNGGGIWGTNDTNVVIGVGNYIITCVDQNAGNCTTNDTVVVGNIPTLVASTTPPCVDANTSSIIWSMASPTLNSYHYQIYDPGNNLLSQWTGTFITASTQPGAVGIYTIYVTDTLSGCVDTATIEIFAVPVPDLVLTSSKGCISNGGSATITATPNNPGNYLYQLNGGAPQVSNQFILNTPGTYSVTVVSGEGCASVPKTIHIGDCSKCLPDPIYESATWYSNPTSSIDFGLATPATPIVIDGTLTMDANLDIVGNLNVFFTPWSKIEMLSSGPPQFLNIFKSTLKPCKVSWTGILADNIDENITIDSSTLTGMSTVQGGGVYSGGVNVTNGALITATNSNFLSNTISIVVKDVPFIYGGIIQNNIFEKTVPYPDPVNGIFVYGVKDMSIGGLANINEGNTFRNMSINGIDVRHGNLSYSSHIKLYNNKFENIKYPYAVIPALNDDAILNQSGMWLGSAIAADNYFNNLLTVDIDNTLGDPAAQIVNCDIGISSNNTNLNVANSDITNTLLGIMSKSIIGNVNYNIHDNSINNAHIGIAQYGSIASTQILSNTINTRNAQIFSPTANYDYVSTIGIDINHSLFELNPTGGLYNNIENNMIMVQAKAGIGIMNLSSDSHERMLENNIYFSNISNDPIANSDLYACFGIVNMNAKKTNLTGNYIYGHPSMQGFNNRNRLGVLMSFSPNNVLECNKVRHSRYGFYAWGDNTTSPDKIKYNKFNANAYPWYFLDFGSASPATFGNVGDGLTDNGNEMISVANPINWLNVGGLNPGLFKVFRNSNFPSTDVINTGSNILDFSESGSNPFGNQYGVNDPNVGYGDPCIDPNFIMGGEDTTSTVDSSTLEQATEVAQDSTIYINYPIVGSWMDKYRLFENLNFDSLLLNSTPDMLYFYNTTQSGMIGTIQNANYKINLLSDSTSNDTNFVTRFNDAVTANNAIAGGEEWEMNEYEVNAIKLKIMSGIMDTIGYDTIQIDSVQSLSVPITSAISSADKSFLRELAHTCPFVGGNAVYKARTVLGMFEAGNIYDDRLLCIQGLGKNGNNSNIDIDSLYEEQIRENYKKREMTIMPTIKHKPLEEGDVLLYPNPASTQITIEYKCMTNGEFVLYNSLGQEVMRAELKNGNSTVSLLTNELSKGVYGYRCTFIGCESKNGKLTILK